MSRLDAMTIIGATISGGILMLASHCQPGVPPYGRLGGAGGPRITTYEVRPKSPASAPVAKSTPTPRAVINRAQVEQRLDRIAEHPDPAYRVQEKLRILKNLPPQTLRKALEEALDEVLDDARGGQSMDAVQRPESLENGGAQ